MSRLYPEFWIRQIATKPRPGIPGVAYLFLLLMFEQLTTLENLFQAYRKASRGKRGQPAVAEFDYRLEELLIALSAELLSGVYQPGGYKSFFIHDPKYRLISAAPFRDRVVHHALCNVIEPVFEKSFIDDSFANRVGKGTHRALNRTQQFARKFRYVLQCDIKQFFPSIDHLLLRDIIRLKLGDERILDLVDMILKSGEGVFGDHYKMMYFPGDDLLSSVRARGLPIGNLTSQFWANVYLNPFDHFVKRELRCKAYLRYVDDFLLFSDDKKSLWDWRTRIVKRLEESRLAIHSGSHPKPVTEGIPFLGFRLFKDKRRLKRRNAVNFERNLKKLISRYESNEIGMNAVSASVKGWVNHAQYGNTVGLRKSVFSRVSLRKLKSAT